MRWIAGFLLVCAAVLKAVELLNEPAATMLSPFGRLFHPIQIGVELAVGLALLSGLYWRTLRWLTVMFFSVFAGYSLYLAINGAASCGCFGPVRVHPWWTFLLDIGVAFGLLISAVHSVQERSFGTKVGDARLVHFTDPRKMVAAVMGVSIVTTVLLVRYVGRQTAAAQEGAMMSASLVVLEPERWIGQKLPISDFIDIDLSKGNWIVLLHRHDCPDCQEAVPQYEQLAVAGHRVALVEVPPYGHFVPQASACQLGRLKDNREWFVQTPVEIQLQRGRVIAATRHGH